MKDFKTRITVFTATYNRGYTLDKLYNSLKRQSFKNFDWLIVDDGSTDNTEQIVGNWIKKEKTFNIYYLKKNNGGKCSAINYGLDYVKGEIFFNVDSDDYLTEDALEKINSWFNSLPKNELFCGVIGNLGLSEAFTPNTPFKGKYRDGNFLERYEDYSNDPIVGERAYAFYTEIITTYKYPVFEGENFMTEAVTWNRMANDGYKARFFNDIIVIYEYHQDGLTLKGNKLFLNNPKGHALWLQEKATFLNYGIFKRFLSVYSYYCSFKNLLSIKQISEYIQASILMVFTSKIIHEVLTSFKRIQKSIVERSKVFLIKHFWLTKGYYQIKKLKNKHLNQRCFIVGNGPSLKADDLETLHRNDEICFGFNRIYLIFNETSWKPTYYMSQDEKMLKGSIEEINKFEVPMKFTNLQNKYYHDIQMNRAVHYKMLFNSIDDRTQLTQFSSDCSKGIFAGGTVVYSAIQLAIYMGFTEIYLIGTDHTFNKSVNNEGEIIIDNSIKDYFSDKYNADKNDLYIPNTERTTKTYQDTLHYTSLKGAKVYNATRGGKLEVFPRVKFEELFNDQ